MGGKRHLGACWVSGIKERAAAILRLSGKGLRDQIAFYILKQFGCCALNWETYKRKQYLHIRLCHRGRQKYSLSVPMIA